MEIKSTPDKKISGKGCLVFIKKRRTRLPIFYRKSQKPRTQKSDSLFGTQRHHPEKTEIDIALIPCFWMRGTGSSTDYQFLAYGEKKVIRTIEIFFPVETTGSILTKKAIRFYARISKV
jgi:hypothetical protein